MAVFYSKNQCKNELMTKHDTTRKVEQLRFYKTDDEVCKIIGISKNTLYKRLRDSSWKVAEIYLIERYKL